MLRGEVWNYRPALIRRENDSGLRVITSADELNTRPGQRLVRGVHLLIADDRNLLTVPTGHGYAAAMTDELIIARRLDERVGVLSADELDALDVALRTMLGL